MVWAGMAATDYQYSDNGAISQTNGRTDSSEINIDSTFVVNGQVMFYGLTTEAMHHFDSRNGIGFRIEWFLWVIGIRIKVELNTIGSEPEPN